jgi:uncharacterized RDD family membrane protein YckC
VRRQTTPSSMFAPPLSTKVCAHCSGRLSRTAAWCPTCQKSTLPHIAGKLASPAKRLAAYLFDILAPSFGTGAISRLLLGAGPGHGKLTTAILLTWAVWSMFLFANGMTPGKWLVNIYVIDEAGDPAGFFRMLVREWIGKPISMMVFCLGYVWILIDQDNQGWHDKLVDTYVVED